jgi:hypothetical protein
LNGQFGVDAYHAFYAITPIKDADPKTFRVLDSSLEYFSGQCFLCSAYVADAQSVWYAGWAFTRVRNADPASFISLGGGYGCDRERIYFEGKVIEGADRVTWRRWAGLLSIDRNNVYFTNKKIKGVDRPSVCLLTVQDSFMDRHRIYRCNRALTPDEYLKHLESVEWNCAFEREKIPSGWLFERVASEHPDVL